MFYIIAPLQSFYISQLGLTSLSNTLLGKRNVKFLAYMYSTNTRFLAKLLTGTLCVCTVHLDPSSRGIKKLLVGTADEEVRKSEHMQIKEVAKKK